MRLLKCHIENFGKLKNFEFDFSHGFNNIKEENGWGKSTFATFIKSMFYGLPSTTKRNLDENKRKKYMPWQGGAFGGNIEFSINDKQYRIERFFGKNNSEDTFVLIDLATGKKSKDYLENIGEQLFGLDEDAFERSSFIPQKLLNSSINESISNKLTNLIQGTNEKFNLEEAQKLLNGKRVNLHNNKGTGQIQKIESDIDDLTLKINELENSASTITDIQKLIDTQDEKINSLIKEQNQIKNQILEYSKLQEKKANYDYYEKLNQQVVSTQKEIQEKEFVLNNQNPTFIEIDSYLELNNSIVQKEQKLQIQKENNYLQQRYQSLKKYFENKEIPNKGKITEITDDILRFNNLKNQNENIQSLPKPQLSNKKVLMSVLIVFSVISLLCGVFVLKSSMLFAVIAFVIGVITLLSAGFVYLVNMINTKTNQHHFNYEQLQKNQNEILQLKNKIDSFLNLYENYYTDYLSAINNIILNVKDYENLKQQVNLTVEDNNQLVKSINQDQIKIISYLSKFRLDNIDGLFEKLSYLRQTIIELSKLQEKLKQEQIELENFKREKNFNLEENEFQNISINDLQQKEQEYQSRIDECRDLRAGYVANINKIQDNISILNDLYTEKDLHKSKLDLLNRDLFAVKNAMKFLNEANDSLSSKFLDPMRNGIIKYLNLITGKNFDNLRLDTEFKITFEEYGKSREIEYYSKGYKNTIDLCMRFALIDCLFVKEKPFIILDDPFVNMDDTKIKNAKQFLVELSKQYQIIYFSCHDSRC